MIHHSCFFILITKVLLIVNICHSQSIIDKPNNTRLQIELLTNGDTIYENQPFLIRIKLHNSSNKTIYIPKKIDLTSNIYPNGVNEIWDGGLVNLTITPVSDWAAMVEENTIMIENINFIKVKPKSSIEHSLVEFKSYIESFNKLMNDSEELKIKDKKVYQLQASYENRKVKKGKENQTFLGFVESQTKTIYMK